MSASNARAGADLAVKQLELDERAITRHHGYLLAHASGLELRLR